MIRYGRLNATLCNTSWLLEVPLKKNTWKGVQIANLFTCLILLQGIPNPMIILHFLVVANDVTFGYHIFTRVLILVIISRPHASSQISYPKQTGGQLTIFYAGNINVYDNVPIGKVYMHLLSSNLFS